MSVLNRNAQVRADGTWDLPNIPANMGPVRARVTCVLDGKTISGESDPFVVPPNGRVNAPRIHFGRRTPIPSALTVSAPSLRLSEIGATLQLSVTARYSDGTSKNVTAASNGTLYTISNSAFATLSPNGLLTAVASGTVIIQARLEGASGMFSVAVTLAGGDSDGDGIPDDVELARGMNPNNPIDALEDFDRDGLSNLQEYQIGTDLRDADDDNDGLLDGREVALGTSPLLFDSDGDGISDGLEVQTKSDPLDEGSYNLVDALRSIQVLPSNFTLIFNTIVGEAFRQMTVRGTLLDGTTIDLTSRQRGTDYNSSDLNTCSFSTVDGRVFAGVSGSCTITASVAGFSAVAIGSVNTVAPAPLSFVSIPGFANNVDVNGDFAYVAAGSAGLQVVDVSDRSNPQIVGSVLLSGNANDVKLAGSRAYVASGQAGLHIVDITNPVAPLRLGTVDTPGDATDIRVVGNLAFLASGASGLQLIDVTVPAAPYLIGSFQTAAPANGVDVSGDIAVVAAGGAGLLVLNVANPAKPMMLGSVGLPDEARDVVARGSIAFVADYTGSLQIVDFSNPQAPTVMGSTPGEQAGYLLDVAVAGPFVFGADVLFVNGVPIVDASNPNSPIPRDRVDFVGFRDDDGTGIAVDGSYLYLTASHGIQENGTNGDTRLYIGQYRSLEDIGGLPPIVGIISPAQGSTFIENEVIPVQVSATDDVAVVAVNLVVEGGAPLADTSTPYTFSVKAPVGVTSFRLDASATDLASNTGVAASVVINVIPDPLTTVEGLVVGDNQQPIAGVTVSVLERPAITDADGRFSITGVATVQRALVATAVLAQNDGTVLFGASLALTPVRGGITNAGTIVLRSAGFENDFGTLVAQCSDCSVNATLPFSFPFYGVARDNVYVHSNGIAGFDFQPDEYGSSFFGASPTIGPFFSQLFHQDSGEMPAPGMYVNDSLPGRFVVTWLKQRSVYDDRPNTFQLILFADGRIQFGYRGMGSRDAIVGVTPGNVGPGDPLVKLVDFSATQTISLDAGDAVYEPFGFFDPETGDKPFDLDGGFVTFTLNADGGYDVLRIPGPPPVVTIGSLPAGTTLIAGSTVPITVDLDSPTALSTVSLIVNGAILANDSTSPYEFLLTVPAGVNSLTISASATDSAGQTGTSASQSLVVIPDPMTTVEGRVVNRSGEAIAGAQVTVNLSGVSAEVFDFAEPLTEIPILEGRSTDRVKLVSAFNLRNPDGVFGADPFELGSAASRVVRFSANLRITAPGWYAFKLDVHEGGLLLVDGNPVTDVGPDLTQISGQFQLIEGSAFLNPGLIPIEVITFDNGNLDVRLEYEPPDGERIVVPPSVLTPVFSTFQTTSDSDGRYSISDIPSAFGDLSVTAKLTAPTGTAIGTTAKVNPVSGGTTLLGDLVLTATEFEPDLGTRVCEFCDFSRAIPFVFPSSGNVDESIAVSPYGYVSFESGLFLEPFYSPYFFANVGDPTAGLYVNDSLPDRFVVTWNKLLGGSENGSNTVQLVLFSDGRIQYGYQAVSLPYYAEVGLFPPPAFVGFQVDFSADAIPSVGPGMYVYENFFLDFNGFDLTGGFVLFSPAAGGGYDIRHVADTVSPVCAIVSPADGATLFEGEHLMVSVNSTDNVGTTHTRFTSSDGSLNVEDTSSPFSAAYTVPIGVNQIIISAQAFDRAGNGGVCTATASVTPGPPPTVAITSPIAGATLTEGSTIPITVDASQNRVPVNRLDLLINGVTFSGIDGAASNQFLVTVPAGLTALNVGASAQDTTGKVGTADSVTVAVEPDQLTTVVGRTVDHADEAIEGAEIILDVRGLSAEVFDFMEPLMSLPDLTGRTADRTKPVSALSLRNPDGVFGQDPFGFGSSPSRAIRFSGTLRIDAAGTYTFNLGVNAGGRLVIEDSVVVTLENSVGQFQQASGTIELSADAHAVQLIVFDNGNTEVQLSYAPPQGVLTVVPNSALKAGLAIYEATSEATGMFSIASVAIALGDLAGTATSTHPDGTELRGTSGRFPPVAGGITDIGTIRLRAGRLTGNGKIAFVSSRDGNEEIYVMNSDGTGATNLSKSPGTDNNPAWSPDGTKIAFQSIRSGNLDIYVMNADGSGVVNLTNHAAADTYARWSPDGTRLVFSSDRSGNYEIYTMNADGSGVTRLTFNGASDFSPDWSPDGTKIAFWGGGSSIFNVYTMNVDGTNVTALTSSSLSVQNYSPKWSPDGTKIAFWRGTASSHEVYVINPDGSGLTNLTNNGADDGQPEWSPDGTKIAFFSSRAGGGNRVCVMNSNGSGVNCLTNGGTGQTPDWQPVRPKQ